MSEFKFVISNTETPNLGDEPLKLNLGDEPLKLNLGDEPLKLNLGNESETLSRIESKLDDELLGLDESETKSH